MKAEDVRLGEHVAERERPTRCYIVVGGPSGYLFPGHGQWSVEGDLFALQRCGDIFSAPYLNYPSAIEPTPWCSPMPEVS